MRSPNTSAHSGAQASTRVRFKIRQAWIDQAQARRDLSLCERLIAGRLALHQNLQTGRCNPGIRTLACEAGISERSAFRAVFGLERKGLIAVNRDPSRGGRNHPNGYRLLLPNADSVSAFGPAETLTAGPRNADSVSAELRELSEDNSLRELSSRRGRDDPSGLIPPGAAAPYGAAPVEESALSSTKTSPPSESGSPEEGPSDEERCSPSENQPQSPSKPNLPKEGFAELQRIWSVRPWPETPKDIAAAEKAYAVVAAEVGDGVILAGARATVAAPAYHGEKARFLKPLGKWLLARGWEKPPPQPASSAPRQHNGNGYRKAKPDLARMMLELGSRAS